jgi:flagellar motor switch protein FliN/FliY
VADSSKKKTEHGQDPQQEVADRPLVDPPSDSGGDESPADPGLAADALGVPQPGVQEITQADVDALLKAAAGPTSDDAGTAACSSHGDTVTSQDSGSERDPTARLDFSAYTDDETAASVDADAGEEHPAMTAPEVVPSREDATAVADRVPGAGTLPATEPWDLAELTPPASSGVDAKRVTMLGDVNLRVRIELGRTRMLVEDVLKLDAGSVVELDKLAGDPVDVFVNDRLIARGEVLVLNDNFCVRVSEVLSHDPHRISA